jgi:hypothetical protein
MSLNDTFGPFPGRPNHPDFAKLANVVLKQDGKTEDADFDFATYIRDFIDADSITHMAQQRASKMMMRNGMNPGLNARVLAMVCAAYMDAFLAGYQFNGNKIIDTLTSMERDAQRAIEQNTGGTAAHAAYLHTRWEAIAECLRVAKDEEADAEG